MRIIPQAITEGVPPCTITISRSENHRLVGGPSLYLCFDNVRLLFVCDLLCIVDCHLGNTGSIIPSMFWMQWMVALRGHIMILSYVQPVCSISGRHWHPFKCVHVLLLLLLDTHSWLVQSRTLVNCPPFLLRSSEFPCVKFRFTSFCLWNLPFWFGG